MKSDLERMYYAGKAEIPAAAQRLHGIANAFHDRLATLDAQAALAGDPAVLSNMLRVGGDTYELLGRAVGTLNDCATAVISTADDFRDTDDRARQDYDRMNGQLRDLPQPAPQSAPPELTDPEDPGAPGTPSTPEPIDPAQDRDQRDNPGFDPTDRWGV